MILTRQYLLPNLYLLAGEFGAGPESSRRMSGRGFSLVELSIVLVILGLLVGGVLSGQSLIHAAELRAVSQEYSKYTTALNSFKDKYFALPGDMKNATSFWGIAGGSTGNDAACYGTASTDSTTCNGNGDGLIANSMLGNNYWDTPWGGEAYLFWKHLANAGLIEGSFTGTTGGGNLYTSIPANSPRSKYTGNAFWAVWNWGQAFDGGGQNFYYNYGNWFSVGQQSPNNQPDRSASFTPADLWNIDTKIDDGKPGTGKMIAVNITTCTDTTDENAWVTANYALTTPTAVCGVIFPNAF